MSALDEAFVDFLSTAFTSEGHKLDASLRAAFEIAFFHGAACAIELAKERGLEAVRTDFCGHMARMDNIINGTVKL